MNPNPQQVLQLRDIHLPGAAGILAAGAGLVAGRGGH